MRQRLLWGAWWGAAAAAVFLSVLPGRLMAQEEAGTIEGEVVMTGSGDGIPGAQVSVEGTLQRQLTGAGGRFRFNAVPAGSWTVMVRAIGYASRHEVVTLTAGGLVHLAFQLDPVPVLLPDVVVSASRETERAGEVALTIGVVDSGVIAGVRPHHPSDLVGRVAGAWVANLGGEGHMTAIRQPITTKPMYAFLEDGVPIRSTGFFNHNGLYEIDIPQADRVEIIKGPGSALYGSDAVGGVVNVITAAAPRRPGAQVVVEGGGYGYRRLLATGGGTWGREGVRANLNLTSADGFRARAPYQRQSGVFRWDHALSPGRSLRTVFALSLIDQPADGGGDIPQADYTAGNLDTNYTPITFRRVTALRVASTYESQSERGFGGVTLYARFNRLELMPYWQLGYDPQIWDSRHRSIGVLSRIRRTALGGRAAASAGLDLELSPGSRVERAIAPVRNGAAYTGYARGAVQYDYDVTFWQAAPYVQLDLHPASRLTLGLGTRYDWVGYDYANHLGVVDTGSHRRPASTSVSFRRLSPKVGAVYRVSDAASLFASYRAAFRAPAENQLFRQGAAVNSVDLQPVRARNLEVGGRAALGARASVEVTAYTLHLYDDILTFFDPSTGLRTAVNAGQTRHRGLELSLGLRPLDWWRLDGSLSWARHRYVEWSPRAGVDYSGQEMETAPRVMGRASSRWSPRFLGTGGVTLEWVHLGRYYQNPENTARYPGHDLFNAQATIPIGTRLEITGRLQNLTNRRFAETSSFTALQGARFRPGQPRSLYVSAQLAVGR